MVDGFCIIPGLASISQNQASSIMSRSHLGHQTHSSHAAILIVTRSHLSQHTNSIHEQPSRVMSAPRPHFAQREAGTVAELGLPIVSNETVLFFADDDTPPEPWRYEWNGDHERLRAATKPVRAAYQEIIALEAWILAPLLKDPKHFRPDAWPGRTRLEVELSFQEEMEQLEK